MGGNNSVSAPGGIGSSQVGCCGKRGGAFVLCRNERLNAYLEQLGKANKEFDSAWLYREEVTVVPNLEQFTYILLFQRSEIKEVNQQKEAAGEGKQPLALPGRVRRHLRFDWGRDGLAFMEIDRRLPEELLVRSKVFQPCLRPSDVLRTLVDLQSRTFDSETWNSSAFCYHMLGQAPGKEYEYR
eukprot:CAMPEP_0175266498 /NCGR_PEP_ID=MMETSP0093-20121207/43364_1 /TAXON_ID=311494 /ORGANISM="Alexandrium monilatum, Strain CCMP3105" /LENGTH=183 /DNA_ID=CAMNT_0016561105 /DNA_START=8 /DNA_END=559 /DNA_ORIENTATION=+